jgi:hypothetical protein
MSSNSLRAGREGPEDAHDVNSSRSVQTAKTRAMESLPF